MSRDALDGYEVVIGLEVHVQLSTATKLFCGCANRFGDEPNRNVCAVCLGYPGALPAPNREAVRLAVRAGLAFGCRIARESRFDRKNYFYPDLPKGYQISQFAEPYAHGGEVEFELGGAARRVPLVRIHIEEDAGKSVHGADGRTRIDLNRCGTPLLEIVTEPALSTGAEAAAFLHAVREMVRWLGVSDGNMEEGSLRCDVNLSLRPRGAELLGTRTEMKNLNSFAFVEQAIVAESARQAEILARGGRVLQETRVFDPDRGESTAMRGKEEAHDYRYFPEPDLRPLAIPPAWIEAERSALPELPLRRRRRYVEMLGLPPADAVALTGARGTSEYFEALLAAGTKPRSAANWIRSEALRAANELGIPMERYAVPPADFARVIAAAESERIGVAAGREILARAASGEGTVDALLAARGEQVSDATALIEWIERVIAANGDAAAKVRAGDAKPLGFLTGQVMQLSAGKANAKRVTELLRQRLSGEGSPPG